MLIDGCSGVNLLRTDIVRESNSDGRGVVTYGRFFVMENLSREVILCLVRLCLCLTTVSLSLYTPWGVDHFLNLNPLSHLSFINIFFCKVLYCAVRTT